MKNVGQHLAIKAGIDACSGDYAIVMDCDLQDNPKEIPNFYNKIKECGADAVWGRRISRQEGFLKKLYSKTASMISSKLSDANVSEDDKHCGNYSIISKKIIDELKQRNEPYFVFGTIVSTLGFSKQYLKIEQESRACGKSGYNFFKGLKLFLRILINNSNKPLLFSALCAVILFVLCGVFTLKVIIWHILFGQRIVGYTSIMASIYLIGGLLFLNLGLISLYIGQIFKMTQNRPIYMIKKKVNL